MRDKLTEVYVRLESARDNLTRLVATHPHHGWRIEQMDEILALLNNPEELSELLTKTFRCPLATMRSGLETEVSFEKRYYIAPKTGQKVELPISEVACVVCAARGRPFTHLGTDEYQHTPQYLCPVFGFDKNTWFFQLPEEQ